MRRILPAILVAFLILGCLCGSAHAWIRSTSSVPPDDNAYRLIDKLIAFSLVEPPIRGQRPYPRLLASSEQMRILLIMVAMTIM